MIRWVHRFWDWLGSDGGYDRKVIAHRDRSAGARRGWETRKRRSMAEKVAAPGGQPHMHNGIIQSIQLADEERQRWEQVAATALDQPQSKP